MKYGGSWRSTKRGNASVLTLICSRKLSCTTNPSPSRGHKNLKCFAVHAQNFYSIVVRHM